MKIDETDKKVLIALEKEAKMTINQLSHKLNLPITTVHNRIKKLEREKVITGYTVLIDHRKLGKEIAAYILLTVDYAILQQHGSSQQEVAKRIKNLDFVEEVAIIASSYDILVKIRITNINALNNFVTNDLRNIQGIEKTQTLIILSEIS